MLTSLLIMTSGTQYSPLLGPFEQLHWHHANEFSFSSWHGILTMAATLFLSFIVIKKLIQLFDASHKVSSLLALAEPDRDGFHQLEAEVFTAFTAGYSDPKCYITSALKAELTRKELYILKLHEDEHIRQGDPLKKWLFQLLALFFPKFFSALLNKRMTLAMEQCADTAISARVHDKALIAMTLLKVRRLTAQTNNGSLGMLSACHYAHDNIEERISYILAVEKTKKIPCLFVSLLACAFIVGCTLSADNFHHFVEYTLSH